LSTKYTLPSSLFYFVCILLCASKEPLEGKELGLDKIQYPCFASNARL